MAPSTTAAAAPSDLLERLYSLLQAGELEGASVLLEELEAVAPQGPEQALGRAAVVAHTDPEGSIAVLDEARRRWPDDARLLVARGSHLLELFGDTGAALRALELAVTHLEHQREPQADELLEARLLLADCLLSAGDAERATKMADSVIAAAPSSTTALLLRAAASFAMWQLDDAAKRVRSVLSLDRELADAHGLLGRIAQAEGHHDDANAHFERAHALEPDRFPLPCRVERRRLIELYRAALEELPPLARTWLHGASLTIEDTPRPMAPPARAEGRAPDATCFFEQSPRPDADGTRGAVPLYQRNLELLAADEE
ncbi:MAG: hypothetical protein ACO3JL_12800, partial [Myxococcota bacterium]